MRKIHPLLLILLLPFLLITRSCKEDENASDKSISLTNKEFVGCISQVLNQNTKDSYEDTVFYSIHDGILTLRVLMNYNCCGLLTDSVDISGSEVNIFVNDTCTIDCSCRCTCNFQFYYHFTNFFQKNTYFKVYLKELGSPDYELWKQTKFIDGLD